MMPATIKMRNNRKPGYSLVEMLYALGLLALGFISVMGMFPTAFSGIHHSKNLMLAGNIAQSELEKLRFVDYEAVTSQERTSVPINSEVNGVPVTVLFTRQITVTPNLANTMKNVVVIITWREKGEGEGGGRLYSQRFETSIGRQQ